MRYIRIKPGDIVRRFKDGVLCYVYETNESGMFGDYVSYSYTTETGESVTTQHTTEKLFGFVARRFFLKDLNPYDKIFVWKSGRWFAEMVSSRNDKFVWTMGHGRVSYKDVVPYMQETRELFGKTDREKVMKFHQIRDSHEFLDYISGKSSHLSKMRLSL